MNEIGPIRYASGASLNCTLASEAGDVWDRVAGNWSAAATAVYGNCTLAMAEQGVTGRYYASLPVSANLDVTKRYNACIYLAAATGFGDTANVVSEGTVEPQGALTGQQMDLVPTTVTAIQNGLATTAGLVSAIWTYTTRRLTDAVLGDGSTLAKTSEALGTGSDACTITITSGGLASAGSKVWVTSDSPGANVVAGTLLTDSLGHVRFLLTNGLAYYLWMEKDGTNPILSQQFTAIKD